MICPHCGHPDSIVTDTRLTGSDRQQVVSIRRRRRCYGCNGRWTTYEVSMTSEMVSWLAERYNKHVKEDVGHGQKICARGKGGRYVPD